MQLYKYTLGYASIPPWQDINILLTCKGTGHLNLNEGSIYFITSAIPRFSSNSPIGKKYMFISGSSYIFKSLFN